MEQDLLKALETKPCSRCGGSGKYSWCQMYGDTCFKCKGKGTVYTKRAMAAIEYGSSLQKMPANEAQIGWLMYVEPSPFGGKSGWFPIVSIGPSGDKWAKKNEAGETEWFPYFSISTGEMSRGFCYGTDLVQVVPNRERLQEIKELRLQYQAGLTKDGKPSKR